MNKSQISAEVGHMIDELLSQDKELSFNMQGNSMFPTLKSGDRGIIQKCVAAELKPGQIIVFKQDQQYIAHRFLGKTKNNLLLARGDNNSFTDKPFGEDNLVGTVTSRVRNGRNQSLKRWSDVMRTQLTISNFNLMFKCNRSCFRLSTFPGRYIQQFNTFSSNIRLIAKDSGKLLRMNMLIAVMQSVLPLLSIFLIKLLIDSLSNPGASSLIFYHPYFLVGVTGMVFLLNGLLSDYRSIAMEKLIQSVSRETFAKLQNKHLTLDLSYFESANKQDAAHQAVQEAAYRPMRVISNLLSLVRSVVSALLIFVLYLTIEWYFILILVAAIAPGFIFKIKYARKYFDFKKSRRTDERLMNYFNRVMTAQPFAKEIRLFGFSDYFKFKYNKVQQSLFSGKLEMLQKEFRQSIFSQIFSVLLLFLLLAIMVHSYMNGKMTLGTIVLFIFLFQRGYSTLKELFSTMGQMVEDHYFLKILQEFFDVPENQLQTSSAVKVQGNILLENVSFQYPQGSRPALNSINLEVKAGQTIALVGANGSGKTTLIKILAGLYQPSQGKVLFDHQIIGVDQIRKNITAVFQDFALYQVSVGDNIRLGNIHRDFDELRMKDAAHQSDIEELIERFPLKYNQPLGVLNENGEELSMGQWQKLSIARALYADAPIVLLDEPSSALDAKSEKHLTALMKQLSHNKTTIVVSHNLTLVNWADLIYFLDRGELTESGTHEELMALKGSYYEMYMAHTRLNVE